MIIKKLTLNNFGVYAGTNTFEFSCTRPIVLIGGMNGRGKTTFLEAILLSLYGSNSGPFKESSCSSYGTYLRSLINKHNLDQPCFIELEFTMNESSSETYMIRREWNAFSKRTNEQIVVHQNGVLNEFLTSNWAMFIENILPSALSNFYFFDGEKIAELAVDNTNAQMKDSIRAMLGIGVLDVLKSDLNKILKRTNKKLICSNTLAELQALRDEQNCLESELKKLAIGVDLQASKIQATKDKLEKLRNKYATKGGAAMEQRRSLMQQRYDLLSEMEQNQAALVELASGELPLVLLKDLIKKIKFQAEDEHHDSIMQEALLQLDDLLVEFSEKDPQKSSISREFISFVRDKSAADSTDTIYQLSDHALFQLTALAETLLEGSQQKATELLQQKEALQKALDHVDSYLSLDINEKELQGILASIKKAETELVHLETNFSAIENRYHELQTVLATKEREYSIAVESYLSDVEASDDAERTLKYATMALAVTARYTTVLQSRKTDILGITITKCYQQLANKKNLIHRIVMNPETLDLKYLDILGKGVAKDSLSAGEKQLMVIAILWALAICSKKKLPVIIDTPLSRLDSMHRTSLVTTYFPNASAQTIILSTDSEIDRNYYNLMKDFIGDEFTLSYNEETQSTSILKGYFQEP